MPSHEQFRVSNEDNQEDQATTLEVKSSSNKNEVIDRANRKRENAIGAAVLTLIGFQEKISPQTKKAIVTPYYEKRLNEIKKAESIAKAEAVRTGEAPKKIEKIPGNNPKEKKNYAYLERLDKAIDSYGNRIEKRIWQESVKSNAFIIEKDNISKKSWTQLEREFMIDNVGKGLNIPFDEEARQRSYEKIKKDRRIV